MMQVDLSLDFFQIKNPVVQNTNSVIVVIMIRLDVRKLQQWRKIEDDEEDLNHENNIIVLK